MKAKKILYLVIIALATTSCSDFFELDSDHVAFTNHKHINEPGDSIYSLTGILQKLQTLGDRTVLLGEVRGDLVTVTDAASSDLRQLATFSVSDDNAYNNPRDYHAVINNCNFYIAKADTSLKDSRGNSIFMREYAAVKAIRAWTYLQLALNYGRIPFVTVPVLTKDEAEKNYPMADIKTVCDYFISDLQPLANVERPGLGTIGSVDSRFLYFPINLLLGELNLWAGNYKEAALAYYRYIATANGGNSYYPVKAQYVHWNNSNWNMVISRGNYAGSFANETWTSDRDLITMIPGDSLILQGNYSQLRNIFNSTSANNGKVSLTPSVALQTLSEAQSNNVISTDKDHTTLYAPTKLDNNMSGDLRLQAVWSHYSNGRNGENNDYQYIWKFTTRNVHIYRRTMVYLRMAEALNRAGYPHFAYQILARGVNNQVINDEVLSHCTSEADSTFVRQFDFPSTSNSGYIVFDKNDMDANYNTIGIHSRGAGWACYDKNYQMPFDEALSGEALKQWQINKVEDMIVDEDALEGAFEGTRYYTLLRVALRRSDLGYLVNRIKARDGQGTSSISRDLLQPSNLFLHWNGKIGY